MLIAYLGHTGMSGRNEEKMKEKERKKKEKKKGKKHWGEES